MNKHVNVKQVKDSYDKIQSSPNLESMQINGGALARPLYGIKIPIFHPLYGIVPYDDTLSPKI